MKERKEIKLADIAHALGTSTVSVSNALNDRKGVSEELRRRVKEKAKELGYKQPCAVPKKENKSYCIGVMIAERYVLEFPSFYMDVYKQIAQLVTKKGSLMLLDVVDSEREKLKSPPKFFQNMKVDGIIIVGGMETGFIREVRRKMKVPAVGVEFYDLSEEMDYIVTDNLHGMQEMTRILMDAGYRDIAFLGDPYSSAGVMDQYMGYCMALKKGNNQTKYHERLIREFTVDNIGEAESELPEAFAVSREKTAYMLIEQLQHGGIRVPEDVAVVSFGHMQAQGDEHMLTVYESNEKLLAQSALHTLLKRIQGKSADEESGCIQTIEGNVIIGNTVAERR